METKQNGKVHLYVGDGKGKTTAAVGLAVRFLGQGKTVLFCQFLKGGKTGEIQSLTTLGAQILRAKHGTKFTFQMTPEELAESRIHHKDSLAEAQNILSAGTVDLVVLDEVVDAVNAGLLDVEALVHLVASRPAQVELVMTGRNPDPALQALADYHTEFVCRAHPYQKGVPARKGVEF